jgi:hypothetical protein
VRRYNVLSQLLPEDQERSLPQGFQNMLQTLRVRSREREELVEFTDEVQRKLTDSAEQEGVVVLYVQHTTAGLTVNENADPDVPRDMLHAFRTLLPQHGMGFRHGEKIPMLILKPPSLVHPSPYPSAKANFYSGVGREFFYVSLMAAASAK